MDNLFTSCGDSINGLTSNQVLGAGVFTDRTRIVPMSLVIIVPKWKEAEG
jgi:hypothetical protein